MNIFSKINSVFLAAAILFSTFGQLQILQGVEHVFTHSTANDAATYSNISSQNIWGVINLDGSNSLFNLFSNSESEEDRKNSLESITGRESAFTKISSLYLLFARDIALSPSIGDLLYPFHFYF
jgi:hypothetical protein